MEQQDCVLVLIGKENNTVIPSFCEEVTQKIKSFGIETGHADTLSTGKAWELSLKGNLTDLRTQCKELRSFLAERQIDMGIVLAYNRRKKMLLADMDSTIITIECIDELADYAGVKEQVAGITAAAMRGELNFEQSLMQRVALLRGLSVSALDECYKDRVRFMAGAEVLVKTMRHHGAFCALVSGGFTFFTHRVAEHIGFNTHRANTLNVDKAVLTGTVNVPILGKEAKKEALQEFCNEHGLAHDDVVAVGDGANDLAMIHTAGLGVAAHAKPAVASAADVQINFAGLEALLYLQGYKEDEFVAVN